MALLTGLILGAIAFKAMANPAGEEEVLDFKDISHNDNADKSDSDSIDATTSILSSGVGGIIDDLF